MSRMINQKAPSITCRAPIKHPLLTGFIVIDALTPIGRGQRQLILGDFNTGKTYLAKCIVMNQKRNNRIYSPEGLGADRIFCFYCAIGLRTGEVVRIRHFLRTKGAMWYTEMIAATAATTADWQHFSPYFATSYAELYRDAGYNSLVIFDSLSNHAIAHRQKFLLLDETPGREAYPASTFYAHATLLERFAQMSKKHGYGSMSALPIVETFGNNITAYVPTNIISICDGQIFLTKSLSQQRVYPAMDIKKSVSRIGVRVLPPVLKPMAKRLKEMLNDYYTYKEMLRMGYPLTGPEKIRYNKGRCAFNLSQQRIPRFWEINLLLIMAADIGLLCPNFTTISIRKVYNTIFSPHRRWILFVLGVQKHIQRNYSVRKSLNLAAYALTSPYNPNLNKN